MKADALKDDQPTQRIANLIASHLEGTLTKKDRGELDEWITLSDENLEVFEKLSDEDSIKSFLRQYFQKENKGVPALKLRTE